MDKPVSLSVKNFLIQKISVDMAIPENVVEHVVNHQFDGVLNATKSCYSVEVSGFGKFMFNVRKARHKVVTWENFKQRSEQELTQDITPGRRNTLIEKIENITGTLADIKLKLHDD